MHGFIDFAGHPSCFLYSTSFDQLTTSQLWAIASYQSVDAAGTNQHIKCGDLCGDDAVVSMGITLIAIRSCNREQIASAWIR